MLRTEILYQNTDKQNPREHHYVSLRTIATKIVNYIYYFLLREIIGFCGILQDVIAEREEFIRLCHVKRAKP